MAVENIQSVGSIEETPLIDLLIWIEENKFSGVVALARDNLKKSLIFDQGKPIGARSNVVEETLSELLKKNGKISEDQVGQAMQLVEEKKASVFGEALVMLGIIQYLELNDILKEQLLERMFETFAWTEGRYALISKIPPDVNPIIVDMPMGHLCFRGLIHKHMANHEDAKLDQSTKPVPVGGKGIDIQSLGLVGREMGFYRAINGVNSLSQIAEKTKTEAKLAHSMVLAFQDLGLARVHLDQALPEEKRQQASSERAQSAAAGRPKPAAAKAKSEEDKKKTAGIIAEIIRKNDEADKKTLFEILEVEEKASAAEVKKAYFNMARKYHPDRLPPDIAEDERKTAEVYFARISEAHATLSDDEARKEYVASRELEASGMNAESAREILESESKFQEGMVLIRKSAFADAVAAFEKAIELYDQEPEYFLHMGWAMFRSSSKTGNAGDAKKGRQLIEKALKEKDEFVDGYFYLGMIAKAEEDLDKAERYFKQTVQKAPNHEQANSELRVINMRREKKKQGGLKSLFGRKRS